jgi:hypothetical protein
MYDNRVGFFFTPTGKPVGSNESMKLFLSDG